MCDEDLASDKTYIVFLHLEIIELRREIERLQKQNSEYKSYITDSICREQLSKRVMSNESRDKLTFYHKMKETIISNEKLPETTPWYVVKQKSDIMWKTQKYADGNVVEGDIKPYPSDIL